MLDADVVDCLCVRVDGPESQIRGSSRPFEVAESIAHERGWDSDGEYSYHYSQQGDDLRLYFVFYERAQK